ncbi:hypothetical protein GCM10007148_02890 [Parvularcula lutaonensis]|nr:hypothetical protein GCM10007148_02890 [Parvularcula lutaonensis]
MAVFLTSFSLTSKAIGHRRLPEAPHSVRIHTQKQPWVTGRTVGNSWLESGRQPTGHPLPVTAPAGGRRVRKPMTFRANLDAQDYDITGRPHVPGVAFGF